MNFNHTCSVMVWIAKFTAQFEACGRGVGHTTTAQRLHYTEMTYPSRSLSDQST